MYLCRIELAADAADNPAFWREVTTPYGAHQALWNLFRRSTEQSRDFLFRQDSGTGRGATRVCFHVLSKEPPRENVDGLWHIGESKIFSPQLREGDHLRFSLRASPTVKKRSGVEGKKSVRCDVVMDARKNHQTGSTPFDPVAAIQREGERWLQRQAASSGFEISRRSMDIIGNDGLMTEIERSALAVDGYRQHRLPRRGDAPIQFSTADFEGILIVRDPKIFLEKVTLGFGAQKAFGCGLMLLRRA